MNTENAAEEVGGGLSETVSLPLGSSTRQEPVLANEPVPTLRLVAVEVALEASIFQHLATS